MANLLTTAQFQGLELSIIDHNGQKWLTAEQVGAALGYSNNNARDGINKIYKRHSDEFTEQDSAVINLITHFEDKASSNYQRGNPNTRIFSATGCHLLSFFSSTPRAKEFRAWAKQVLAGAVAAPAAAEPKTGMFENLTVSDRLELLEVATVNMGYHMQKLVEVSHQQAEKLEMTSRYIGLLEINQKGKIKVTRAVEAKALALRAQGMSMTDIAQLLRISSGAVSQLVNGKYPFSAAEAAAPQSQTSVQEILDGMVEAERRRLLRKLSQGSM